MYVTIEKYISTFQSLSHHHFSGAVFRALLHAWSYPLTVEIEATEGSSIVAYQYSIRVKHRDNLEDKIVS
jgi:hypothetical protein